MTGLPGLKSARLAAGLTQEEVADLIGVHPQSIYMYESGKSDSSVDVLRRLAAALSCTPGALLDEPEAPAEGAA